MRSNITWISRFFILLFLTCIFLVNWEIDRTNFATIALVYCGAFVAYFALLKQKDLHFRHFVFIALAAHLLAMVYQPNLSVDYYRFLWDGQLPWLGINPFDYKPNEIINQLEFREHVYLNELYSGMSDLSKNNYSCYPTINQFYFTLANSFSSSIAFNTFILKLLILITEFFGAWALLLLLKKYKLSSRKLWILLLNPLWIIECLGNAHFEGVMISFLFIALYFILKLQLYYGAFFFALAVQVKLIPLILLPFFYRFLGWKKALILYCVVMLFTIAIGLVHINADNLYNFIESLTLYFKVFEFNSLVFYNFVEFGRLFYDYNPIRIYGPMLSRFAMFMIVAIALWGDFQSWQSLFKRMTIAFFVYLLLSSTVHPWYILPLMSLAIFTNYSFPFVWSIFIFFTYYFYSVNSGSAIEIRSLITVEYLVVIVVFLYEIIKKKPMIPMFAIRSN